MKRLLTIAAVLLASSAAQAGDSYSFEIGGRTIHIEAPSDCDQPSCVSVSIPGVYGGLLDKVPFGAAFGKGITMKMGQTNMHNYMKPLLQRIEKGQIDPSYIISHRITLDEAPEMYKVWRDKKEGVTKIVINPWADGDGTRHVRASRAEITRSMDSSS